jgi:hypothetical protein
MALYIYPPTPVSVTVPPLQFDLDGVVTDVSQDTVVPGNSTPLPAIILDSAGNPVDWSSLISANAPLAHVQLDFSVTSVTDVAYVQLLATIGATASKKAQIFMSSGDPLLLAFGAPAAEVDKIIVIPGGNGFIDLDIPANTRLSLKALNSGTTVGSGVIIVNLLG